MSLSAKILAVAKGLFEQFGITLTTTSTGTATATTAVIVGAATTAGVRLDLESGDLAVREGDDTGYANLKVNDLTIAGTQTGGAAPAWTTFTPTTTWTSNTTWTARRRTVGSSEEVFYRVAITGAVTAESCVLTLPTAMVGSVLGPDSLYGLAYDVSATTHFALTGIALSTTTVRVMAHAVVGAFVTGVGLYNDYPVTWTNGDSVEVFVAYRIV